MEDDIRWINCENSIWVTVDTSIKTCLLPRRCKSSKKFLWFKKAVRVRHSTYETYEPDLYHSDRWYDQHEYLKLKLMS